MLGIAISAEGVQSDTDLKVSQRAAGANMSVDVAAGKAYVKDDHASANAGGYYWAQFDAVENRAIGAAHATLPRVDRVGVRVRDAYLGDAANDCDIEVLPGTPTAGATLTNLNGAPAIPGSWLLLGNVLVPAASTTVVDANIDSVTGTRAKLALVTSTAPLRKVTQKNVISTTSEVDLLNDEITIAGGAMGTNKIVRGVLWGVLENNAAATFTFRLKFGGTTIWADDGGYNQGAGFRAWRLEFFIANINATNSQSFGGSLLVSDVGGATTGVGNATGTATFGDPIGTDAAISVDTTAAQALKFTAQPNVNSASASVRLKGALIEIV